MTGRQVVDKWVTDLRIDRVGGKGPVPGGPGLRPPDADPSPQYMRSGGLETNARKLATCTAATTAPITTAIRVAPVESVEALERLRRGMTCPQRSGACIRRRSAGRPAGDPSLVGVAIFVGHLVSVCRADRDGLRSRSARYYPCTAHLRPLGASP